MFQRGKRADESVPGQGIGLAVVRETVELYRGTLDVGRPSSAAPSCAWSSRAPDCVSPSRDEIVAARRATRYRLEYPEQLPITAARDELLEAIAQHRVIVVCGDTGSGKTTQLPKLCLEAGRGILGMIGHTQPRRIAAQAVASRLAAELDVRVGEAVGLEMRFTDQTRPTALVKVMTDGILLNEIAATVAYATTTR